MLQQLIHSLSVSIIPQWESKYLQHMLSIAFGQFPPPLDGPIKHVYHIIHLLHAVEEITFMLTIEQNNVSVSKRIYLCLTEEESLLYEVDGHLYECDSLDLFCTILYALLLYKEKQTCVSIHGVCQGISAQASKLEPEEVH